MNHALRVIVSSLGVLLGAVGIFNHGLFEIFQGNIPAAGVIVESVGAGNPFGAPAGEQVLTLIPNLFWSGVATILAGVAMIVWSLACMRRRHGSAVFLALCLLQSLVGGGLAQLPIALLVWAVSTRIDAPLTRDGAPLARDGALRTRWRAALGGTAWRPLARHWRLLLACGIALIAAATQVALFQAAPGVRDAGAAMGVGLLVLLAGVGVIVLTVLAGYAHDLHPTHD